MNPTKEQIAAALALYEDTPLTPEHNLVRVYHAGRILAAALRAAQQDSERLDWLDAEHTRDGRQRPVAALVLKMDFIRDSAEWVNITGTARAAIDAAMRAETAPATPAKG